MRMFLCILPALFLASTATSARTLTAMNFVEKSSYSLQRLVARKQADPSFMTDVSELTVNVTANGAVIEMKSPSAQVNEFNTLTMQFDPAGALTNFAVDFKSMDHSGPLFTPTNAATIIDLSAEAVVDHLSESPDLPIVAQTARQVILAKESSGIHVRIVLSDSRIYNIFMDAQGKVISKGF